VLLPYLLASQHSHAPLLQWALPPRCGPCLRRYAQYNSRGAAQHEFGKGLMLALYLLLRDYFPDQMLAEAEALPLAAWRACVRHGGYRMPFTHFAVAKDQVTPLHRHSDERVGSLFIGMAGARSLESSCPHKSALCKKVKRCLLQHHTFLKILGTAFAEAVGRCMSGDGEPPQHYALLLPELRVWIRLRPGLIIRFNATHLIHAITYDFQMEPPPASELEGKQHMYGEGTL
jgi:hypothetical protein